MFQVIKTNKSMTFKGQDRETIVAKSDYLPRTGLASDKATVYVNGEHFDKPSKNFEEFGEVPEFVTRFTHKKFQEFVKLCVNATEKGFRFRDEMQGTFVSPRDEKPEIQTIDPSWFEGFYENTNPTIVWMSKLNFKDIPDKSGELKVDGEVVMTWSDSLQTVFVDFLKAINTPFTSAFDEAISKLKKLNEDEKRKIEYRRLASSWNQELGARKKDLESQKKSFITSIKSNEVSITQNYTNLRKNELEILNIETLKSQGAEEIIASAKEVEALPFVKNTEYEGTKIIVHLKDFPQEFKYGGEVYTVNYKGPRVVLNPKKVEIYHNNPIKEDGSVVYHMHIKGPDDDEYSDQFVCFGDHATRIQRALGERKFKEVVFLCKVLLGSYNEGDRLYPIEKFLVKMGAAKETEGRLKPVKPAQTTIPEVF